MIHLLRRVLQIVVLVTLKPKLDGEKRREEGEMRRETEGF